LVQRVIVAAQTGITSSNGWYVGGAGLASSIGLYQRFLFGHSSTANINDAGRWAARDYYLGEDPPNTTAKYHFSEGSGTSVAGTVAGSTAGTISGATWIATGQNILPVSQGYVKQLWNRRPATVTAAYVPTYGELVPYDATGGAITMSPPTAVGHAGEMIAYKNMSASTTAMTIDPNGSETIDRAATLAVTTADAHTIIISDGANWGTI
jgi:hypothetical protein